MTDEPQPPGPDEALPIPVEPSASQRISRKPRLTPALEERLAPVDARSAASYAAMEEAGAALDQAGAALGSAGEKLDALVAAVEDGAVHVELHVTDTLVHRLVAVAKKS